MADFKIIKYDDSYYDKWNDFIDVSNNGTIFHRLDFLSYHQDKFKANEHNLIFLKGQQLFAIIPLAIFQIENKEIARSPFGGSYGGIVTRDATNYSTSSELVKLLIEYLKNNQIDELAIILPPAIFNKTQNDTLFFSYLENGFQIINSDISHVVSLKNQNLETKTFSSRARNMARKARKANINLKLNGNMDDFWKILELTFKKLEKEPTHKYLEWKYLCTQFPDKFWNDIAYIGDKPIAGIGHIKINLHSDSSFYLCQDPEYTEKQGLSLLIYESLLQAQKNNLALFDFGTSSTKMIARKNLFLFKESFGATGVFRHTIKLILK